MNQGIRKFIYPAALVALLSAGLFAQEAPPAPAAPDNSAIPATPAAPAPPARAPRHKRTMVIGNNIFVDDDEDVSGSHSYLGVDISNLTSERASELKVSDGTGVEIVMLDGDSPASKAGLKEHDVIRTFNGTKIETGSQLRRLIHETPAGKTVAIGIIRNGQPMTVNVKLADRNKLYSGPLHVEIPPIPPIPPMPPQMFIWTQPSRIGVTVEALTPQLRDFFGAPSGQGLLVRSVEKGSVAEAAGLKAGDVIVRVQNQTVSEPGQFRMALRDQKPGPVAMTVIRERREQNLTVKLPERKTADSSGFWGPDMKDFEFKMEQLGPQLEQLTNQEVNRAMVLKQREIQRALEHSQRELQRSMRLQQKKLQQMQKDLDKQKDEDDNDNDN